MEQMNRVELRGLVGSTRVQTHSGRRVCRMSVATSRAYKDPMGMAKIDTTWHNVSAWEGRGIPDLDQIVKGSKVEVTGSIRNSRNTGIANQWIDLLAFRQEEVEELYKQNTGSCCNDE